MGRGPQADDLPCGAAGRVAVEACTRWPPGPRECQPSRRDHQLAEVGIGSIKTLNERKKSNGA